MADRRRRTPCSWRCGGLLPSAICDLPSASLANPLQYASAMAAMYEPLIVAPEEDSDLAVMLTGGGARAAYQVGLLKGIARHFPNLRFQVIVGVSAGAINAAYLGAHRGTLMETATHLDRMWCELDCDSIYRFDWKVLLPFRSALASLSPRKLRWTQARPRAILDTAPLKALLTRILDVPSHHPIPGIEENLRSGNLRALALMTLDYSTGQTVRWVQGRN